AGADLAGATRLERLAALRHSFEAHGIAVRHDIIPGVGHDDRTLLGTVKDFFAAVLNDRGVVRTPA
uniref:hypothetical protein n=1 Tax=Virgifigura deserti TaxID=2268457 RepID=UPI003CCC20C4